MTIRTFIAVLGTALVALAGAADAAKLKPLHSFCTKSGCPDGAKPWAAPVTDGNGHWYGTTYNGGASDAGTIYEMSYDGTRWVTKNIHSFCTKAGCPDGSHPRGQLIVGTDGSLYGT